MSWFTEMFIKQAKPALDYHSGLGVGYDDTQAYILVDENGNEYPAVLVGEETVFDATANDIREGKTAATEDGVTIGTKEIPAYITTEGIKVINPGEPFVITLNDGKHAYTKLQAVICRYNTSLADSVAVEMTCIEDRVYAAGSTEALSEITIDDGEKAINLGITNTGSNPSLIRYFTYKEE